MSWQGRYKIKNGLVLLLDDYLLWWWQNFLCFWQFTKGLQETHAHGSPRPRSRCQEPAGCHRPIKTQDDQDLIKSKKRAGWGFLMSWRWIMQLLWASHKEKRTFGWISVMDGWKTWTDGQQTWLTETISSLSSLKHASAFLFLSGGGHVLVDIVLFLYFLLRFLLFYPEKHSSSPSSRILKS